jgi:hypothetical protein
VYINLFSLLIILRGPARHVGSEFTVSVGHSAPSDP